MTLTRCENGHFYDGDKYAVCPHCANAGKEENDTVTARHVPLVSEADDKPTATVSVGLSGGGAVSVSTDDGPTIGYFGVADTAAETRDPVVGWLVCVTGKHKGEDFRLKSGKNFIGRDPSMDICLAGEERVSRIRHAAVIFDPKQNCFLAQPGESKELFYLNGELVVSASRLSRGDRLEIGNVELLFAPLCDEAFRWNIEEIDG